MFTKLIRAAVASLVVSSISLAFVPSAGALQRQVPPQASESWIIERHNPTDTNGF